MLCVGNKKGKTELKAMFFLFFLFKRAGCHFGFFKRAGRHEKGAGRLALQKKPRQNTASSKVVVVVIVVLVLLFGRNLWICAIHDGSCCAICGSLVCAGIHGSRRVAACAIC